MEHKRKLGLKWARDLEKILPPSNTTFLKYNKIQGSLGLTNRSYEDYGAYWIVASDLNDEELFDYYTTDIPEAFRCNDAFKKTGRSTNIKRQRRI